MKTFVHKSGNYVAKEFDIQTRQGSRKGYRIVHLSSSSIDFYVGNDMIEDSPDWAEVIKVTPNSSFSQEEINIAFKKAKEYAYHNMAHCFNENTPSLINYLENNFFNHLKYVR